jgi:hypothetical protein
MSTNDFKKEYPHISKVYFEYCSLVKDQNNVLQYFHELQLFKKLGISVDNDETGGLRFIGYKYSDWKEKKFIQETVKYEIADFKESTIQDLFNVFTKILLVDLKFDENLLNEEHQLSEFDEFEKTDIVKDCENFTNKVDQSTWIPEWHLLFYYRICKKINKSQGFRDGAVGRKQVKIVDKKLVESNIGRISKSYYNDDKERNFIDERNQTYMLKTSYIPCSTETLRFRSSFHILPPSLKDVIGVRYDDGIKCYFDGCNMEIMCLAFIANDKNLISAFREERDIHTYITAMKLKKPMYNKYVIKLDDGREIVLGGDSKVEKVKLKNGDEIPIAELKKGDELAE